MTETRACRILAPAKVNLFLAVGPRRGDGFHEIDTLFQAVSLFDEVRVRRVPTGDVTLTVEGPDLGPAEANLAVRAARLFLREVGAREGIALELTKGIPPGAGLGGGSSDAAAVLKALDHLFEAPFGRHRLGELGAALGSDVPFFLGEQCLARGRGRGEILHPLPPLPPADLVVVLPPVHVATGSAYQALGRGGPGSETDGPPSDEPRDWGEVASAARNDFQEVVATMHAEVARSLGALRDEGALPALLSGSGAACFGVFTDASAAAAAARRIRNALGWPARAVRTLVTFPDPQSPAVP